MSHCSKYDQWHDYNTDAALGTQTKKHNGAEIDEKYAFGYHKLHKQEKIKCLHIWMRHHGDGALS